jgi:hypothetical protein
MENVVKIKTPFVTTHRSGYRACHWPRGPGYGLRVIEISTMKLKAIEPKLR